MNARYSSKTFFVFSLLLILTAFGCKKTDSETESESETSTEQQGAEANLEDATDTAEPQVETINIGDDFAELSRESVAGGSARGNDLGINCAGFIAEQPLLILNVEKEQPVRVGVESEADTTLVVKGEGGPYCNDDFDRLDPAIEEVLPVGKYEIYAGVYDAEAGNPAITIHVRPFEQSELGKPEVNTEPRYRSMNLSANFEPQTFELTAGGDQRVDAMNLAPTCVGYIAASAPDVKLDISGVSDPLVIKATSDNDLSLVAYAPDGQWFCNDDADGSNPRLTIEQVPNGTWSVWVGTYAPSTATAQFSVQRGQTQRSNGAE